MSRQKVAIGGELELVTPKEQQDATNQVIDALVSLNQPPVTRVHTDVFAADASGNVGGGGGGQGYVTFQVPTGFRVKIHRVVLDAPSVTPATPLTAGWIRANRDNPNGPLLWYFPGLGGATATSVAPAKIDEGTGAVVLNDGARVVLTGAGLTASIEFILALQMEETPRDGKRSR